jgi:hypothetical protein
MILKTNTRRAKSTNTLSSKGNMLALESCKEV